MQITRPTCFCCGTCISASAASIIPHYMMYSGQHVVFLLFSRHTLSSVKVYVAKCEGLANCIKLKHINNYYENCAILGRACLCVQCVN